ncbi:MAG: 4Fe-4S double cluster binding domain-containing protein [Methanoregula sp.]
MDLNEDIRTCALSHGADYYGVADLTSSHAFILKQGGGHIARYPRAVSIGIILLDALVDLVPDREDFSAAMLYRHNAYDVVNLTLDQIALAVANNLQRAGYQALPVPASKRANDEKIAGAISHKLAAHLAGLGWIGKSCLLVTPDHGPRVRWVTVLTDAPLTATGSVMVQRCGNCTQCVDACPQKAFTDRAFRENEPREARFDAAACDHYFRELEKTWGVAVCGMCLYICPYGRKSKEKRVCG